MNGIAGTLMALMFLGTADVRGETALNSYKVKLAWNANTNVDVTGYRIHFGTASGSYTSNIVLGNVTSATVSGLAEGVNYHFVVCAFNAAGFESAFSNEVNFKPGLHTSQFAIAATGEPILFLRGLIGSPYDIEASEDLTHWFLIDTVTIPAGGSIGFSDPDAASHPRRFYRTRSTDPRHILFLRGPIGSQYDIEASEDLKHWILIGTVTIPEGGSIRFSDPDVASHPKRFYRTRPRFINPG